MDNGKSYKAVYDENIILMYKGELTFDLITTIISTLENKMTELESDRKIKKKFYSIITECIQNLYYHIDESLKNEQALGEYDSRAALVLITARERFYSLVTGNYVPSGQVEKIQERLDKINSVPADGLRELYKRALNDSGFSDKGTGGLGFIDIARKTGQKLIYKFHPVSDDYSYFTFQVKLPHMKGFIADREARLQFYLYLAALFLALAAVFRPVLFTRPAGAFLVLTNLMLGYNLLRAVMRYRSTKVLLNQVESH
jgi:hypothetical protein